LSPLVQVIAQALFPYLDKPFAFFGHSMGALVSFELTRHLRRQYRLGPVHLFVSGHHAPQIPDPDPPVHTLPEPAFLEELSRLNGTPKEVLEHTELMHLMLPTLRADFAVCETYTYTTEPPLDCPISAYGGLQDLEVSRDSLEAWQVQTRTSFSLRMFPGDHFFLHTAQPLLLRVLSWELHQLASNEKESIVYLVKN
ncbi:MAG: thioesterase domain-containing protein, partial [Nitrospira sp.]|nr:thioesterase domain-containing protein [Nitrospira sp.]